jgi:hypothetical protein
MLNEGMATARSVVEQTEREQKSKSTFLTVAMTTQQSNRQNLKILDFKSKQVRISSCMAFGESYVTV